MSAIEAQEHLREGSATTRSTWPTSTRRSPSPRQPRGVGAAVTGIASLRSELWGRNVADVASTRRVSKFAATLRRIDKVNKER
jgi:hypothetical protein